MFQIHSVVYHNFRIVYCHTKEFDTSPEWSITKTYLLGGKLTERVEILSPLSVLAMGTGT